MAARSSGVVARMESRLGGGSARLDSTDPYIFIIVIFSFASIILPLSYSTVSIPFLSWVS